MKPIEIEFSKLEFGTLFYDPFTKSYYRKVSESEAEPEDNDRYYKRINWNVEVNDSFHEDEMIIVY